MWKVSYLEGMGFGYLFILASMVFSWWFLAVETFSSQNYESDPSFFFFCRLGRWVGEGEDWLQLEDLVSYGGSLDWVSPRAACYSRDQSFLLSFVSRFSVLASLVVYAIRVSARNWCTWGVRSVRSV